MPVALIITLLVAIIENAPQIAQAAKDAVAAIRDAFAGGADPTPAELGALADAALAAGASMRAVIALRLAPGGDWHGRSDIPADVLAAFETATKTFARRVA